MLEKLKDFLGINQYRLYYSRKGAETFVKTRHHTRKAHMERIVYEMNRDWPEVDHWMEKD